MFGLSDFWLETRVIILDSQVGLTNFQEDEAKKNFFEKKNPKWLTQKTEFFKIANSQYCFVKISWISPLVSRIF